MSAPPDDLSQFADCLAAVPPDPGRLDRDALLFAAGRASARRGAFWPAAAAALALLSAGLATTLLLRPPERVEVVRVVHVKEKEDGGKTMENGKQKPDNLDIGPSDSSFILPPSSFSSLREGALRESARTPPEAPWVWTSAEEEPSLSSLRLNASSADGGRLP
jgi:hypothetical protein